MTLLTPAQLGHIEILVVDLNFTRAERKAHIKSIIGRDVDHLDELTKIEASQIITQFKEWKENKQV